MCLAVVPQQVEHGITELVYRVDLVAWQLQLQVPGLQVGASPLLSYSHSQPLVSPLLLSPPSLISSGMAVSHCSDQWSSLLGHEMPLEE